MMKIKRFLIFLLSAICLCFGVGCNLFETSLSSSMLSSATFTVGYDYGQIVEGQATLLLSGSTPFFNAEEYNVAPLIAGEEIVVYYNGELSIKEVYPSEVQIDGQIERICKTKSVRSINISFGGAGEGKITADGYTFVNLPEYVIERDNSITPLSEVEKGTILSIVYESASTSTFQPTAIYAYSL